MQQLYVEMLGDLPDIFWKASEGQVRTATSSPTPTATSRHTCFTATAAAVASHHTCLAVSTLLCRYSHSLLCQHTSTYNTSTPSTTYLHL